jgi:hypothetical protein
MQPDLQTLQVPDCSAIQSDQLFLSAHDRSGER